MAPGRLATRLLVALGAFPVAACSVHPDSESAAARPEPATINAAPTPGASDVDSTSFARTLVAKCARVRQGEMVLVSGAPRDARLLEDLAVEVRRLGAFPLVWVESDRMRRMSYVNVPEKFDAQPPAWRVRLAQTADVEIVVDGSESESVLADVAPGRIAARERAAVSVTKTLMQRGVRQIYVGNDLRPTADRAKRFGMSEEALGRVYRAALDVDYDELQATGERIRAALEKPLVSKKTHGDMREIQRVAVRLTAPNGTDVRFDVHGRKAYVSDGVVSADDERRGGAALQTWLPAGEAFVSAVPGTAEGTIVVDRDTWDGVEYQRLVLVFHEGRLESMRADVGGERLAAAYAAGGEGKDAFGGIDIGFNPALVAPSGSRLRSFAAFGNVTVAFGSNTWLGGENASDFEFTSSLAGATLTAGGAAVVKDGEVVK
jgi:leucyl aminopeptidase (aminopeptidase T)